MSVPPGDRGKSSMQFLETAGRIEYRAMQVCRKWPKSWTFLVTNRTIDLACAIHEHAQNANAIFPITTEREREERLIELQRALGANYNFAKKMELAFSLFPICGEKQNATEADLTDKSMNILEEFMNLCADEDDALKGNIHYTRTVPLMGRGSGDSQPEEPAT